MFFDCTLKFNLSLTLLNMTNKEIALLLREVRGTEKRKLLGPGKNLLELMGAPVVKGFLTGTKERLALPSKKPSISSLIEKKKNNQKKEDWIEKDIKSKIPKLDKKKVFIPNQNELTI